MSTSSLTIPTLRRMSNLGKTNIRSISRKSQNFPNIINNVNVRRAVLTGIGVTSLFFFYRSIRKSERNNEIVVTEEQTTKIYSQPDPPSVTLRDQFNFIDKVARKCSDAVVYIEIVDPRRIDSVTNEPLIISNGSGFIFKEDGWILTNAHVIISRPQAIVLAKLNDGTSYQASVEDADMNIDLALLKITTDRKLPILKLGNSSDVIVGEWVVALGSPLSLSHSVTAGVVSSTTRDAEELGLKNHSMRYIQTDAAITFGNSGGPLVNLDGSVIGINNLRITAGISFAIPIDYVKKFLDRSVLSVRALKQQKPKEKFLGITTIALNKEIVKELLFDEHFITTGVDHGVLIWKVMEGTVAMRSGLLPGDIITHVNDIPINVASDIYSVFNANDNIKVDILRNGDKKQIHMNM